MVFQKAERKQAKLKLAMTGPSGSGKTFSSLLIASGIGKKIALIDTENASASLYADRFEFDTLVLKPPYTIQRYLEAMKAAESAGYDVLIVDSLSHAWAGEGGILDKKSKLDARGGNSYVNWAALTPEQEQLFSVIQNANIHMICTMRSKQDYVLELNEKGKSVPKKVGMAPIQRDGAEYQFTTVFDLAMDHAATTSKDRTGLFDGQYFKPTKETGERLMTWLASAKPEEPTKPAPPPAVDQEPRRLPPTVACEKCGGGLVLHSTGVGYLCENASGQNDGHMRIQKKEASKYLNAVQAAVAG
jgi:hypothetical protein